MSEQLSCSTLNEQKVTLQIDGNTVTVPAGTTLVEAAAQAGIRVPTLCHSSWLGATGTCMVCVVGIEGVGLVPSCSSPVADGLKVTTTSPEVIEARRRAVTTLLSDHYADCVAPCSLACPAGVDAQNYLKLVALGLPDEAVALVREANPFPAVHGRVCTRPCEDACRRHCVDEPVAICAVKRFVADQEAEHGMEPVAVQAPTGYKVAVVGAGPAGLTCAYYLARSGHAVTVFEAHARPGGMLRYGIPSYRLPRDVLDREIGYVLQHGVELVTGQALGKDFTIEQLKTQGFDAIFLAVGAHRSQTLGVPGEDDPRVISGIDLLRQLEDGQPPDLGDCVVVVGGGNTAIDAARSALRLGVKEVFLIYRRTRAEMPAHHEEVADAEQEGVKLTFLASPVSVEPNDEGLDLKLIRMELGEPDASGRPRPQPIAGSEYVIKVSTVVAAIGQYPDITGIEGVDGLSVGRGSVLKVDDKSQYTGLDCVFAGGDLTTGAATAVEAVGAGRRAAVAIDRFLNGYEELTELSPFTISKAQSLEEAVNDEFTDVAQVARTAVEHEPVTDRITDFREVARVWDEDTARAETIRCLECGCKAAHDCRLRDIASELELNASEFPSVQRYLSVDRSHPAIEHDPNRCIACGQCVRVCQEVQGVGALALRYRLSTLGNEPGLANTRCESCGQCITVCPTGALTGRREVHPEREVSTVCMYCGAGCRIKLGIRGKAVVSVRPDDKYSVSGGMLCVKGRFGYDFLHHPDRLTTPLLRKNGDLVPVSWDEALQFVALELTKHKGAVGVMGSARCTNEDMYALQKFTRAVLNTNHIDHCARLCHAPTVAGLAQSLGSGAMTNPIDDIELTAGMLVIGSNTTETHPVIGSKIRQAARSGAYLIVANPLWIDLCRDADIWLQQRPGTDVALLSGLAHIIVAEGLMDEDYVSSRCEGYDEFKESLKPFDPASVEAITGVPQFKLYEAARLYAKCEPASILYTMGITQHTHGTNNVLAISNLALITGNVGVRGGGVNPLRGQNNVQGACDMGVLPGLLPGYQATTDPDKRGRFESAYGVKLPETPGLTAMEMHDAIDEGTLTAMYIVGENPMVSNPDLKHLRSSLCKLKLLIVQDIFLTETAELADVVFPAASFAEKDGTFTNTERRVQLLQKAIDPPGAARADWEIISDLATRMGGTGFDWQDASGIMDEIASLSPPYGGMSYGRLEGEGLCWPCPSPDHPGTQALHTERFATANGLAKLVPLQYQPPVEQPDEEYPLVLTTGRVLYHYHTGSTTRRTHALNALYESERVRVNPRDAEKYGIIHGGQITVSSRRGSVTATADVTEGVPEGVVFMTFHFAEACGNMLTLPALDPVAKIPSLKVCSVNIIPA